jgi:hypothetical protein
VWTRRGCGLGFGVFQPTFWVVFEKNVFADPQYPDVLSPSWIIEPYMLTII